VAIKSFRLTNQCNLIEFLTLAEVAELADALRSGRSGRYAHVGSSPTFGTKPCGKQGFLVNRGVLNLPTN
jgi:hypothetical protein